MAESFGRCTSSTVLKPFACSVAGIDIAALRRTFSELMDQAAQKVQDNGYDLDDVIEVRWVACRIEASGAEEVRVNDVALADRERFMRSVLDRIAAVTVCDAKIDAVYIVSAGVDVFVDRRV